MCGAPQSAFARLISSISVRSSAEIFGLPTWLRDRQRQYARKPARCQRITVSGATTVKAASVVGTSRHSQTNNRRSALLRAGLFGDLRLSTLIRWRRTKVRALGWISPISAPQSNLSRWTIGHQHHPIRPSSPAVWSFRQGHVLGAVCSTISPGAACDGPSSSSSTARRGSTARSPQRGTVCRSNDAPYTSTGTCRLPFAA